LTHGTPAKAVSGASLCQDGSPRGVTEQLQLRGTAGPCSAASTEAPISGLIAAVTRPSRTREIG
jgi:hypothetical protein